jgi:hypothetical protein
VADEHNRVILLDFNSLSTVTAIWTGKKIQLARADTFIYIYTDRHLSIYSWSLSLVEKMELNLSYVATNIV